MTNGAYTLEIVYSSDFDVIRTITNGEIDFYIPCPASTNRQGMCIAVILQQMEGYTSFYYNDVLLI
jgi:hypothetical protein